MVESRVAPRTLAGTSCPALALSIGLSSNRSTCDGPPPCQRTTTRRAFGAKCGKPGRADAALVLWPWLGFPPSREASAATPTPVADLPKNWRRVTRAMLSANGLAVGMRKPRTAIILALWIHYSKRTGPLELSLSASWSWFLLCYVGLGPRFVRPAFIKSEGEGHRNSRICSLLLIARQMAEIVTSMPA